MPAWSRSICPTPVKESSPCHVQKAAPSPANPTRKSSSQAKGYFSRRKNVFRVAVQAVEKAGQYAYRDRRTKKRNFRALWIQRINAATRELGLTYGRFIYGLDKAGIEVDRKVLSDLAIHDPAGFAALVEKAKAAQ